MAGDMFSAALISLGAPADKVTGAMELAGSYIGRASVRIEQPETDREQGIRLSIALEKNNNHLSASAAQHFLEKCLQEEKIARPYADFARRALHILIDAERQAHSNSRLDSGKLDITARGVVHSPYVTEAPHQPVSASDGDFYIKVFPEFEQGLYELDSFSHIYILSYLHRSRRYSLSVTPPWQPQENRKQVGLFASRSPNRPSPIGMTLTRLKYIKDACLFTGSLDLFDGTPVIDIKPHIKSLDDNRVGNDGWLTDRDHLRYHKEGILHSHSTEEVVLHEAQDILLDIMGAARGLELLQVDLEKVVCLTPVPVGGGSIRFSHGTLPVPAPAVSAILKSRQIPHVSGPLMTELLTPTGVALLAALKPRWQAREIKMNSMERFGLGLGTKTLESLNGLKVYLKFSA